MTKKLFLFIYFVLMVAFFPSLLAVENKPFIGVGIGLGGKQTSEFYQQTTKAVSSCLDGLCIGNTTSGSYTSDKGISFSGVVGDEVFFDSYGVSGLRVYGGFTYAKVSLGNLITDSVKDTGLKDRQFQTITGFDAMDKPTIGLVPMKPAPAPQKSFFNNGVWNTYSLNLDFFLNLPIDILIRELFWNQAPFFKIGAYVGGGVEYATLKKKSWINEAVEKNGEFFASGSGFFFNFGGSIYLGSHNRIDIGMKIPYYKLNSQNWYGYGDLDPWKQQTLKQNFDIKRSRELRISYVFIF